MTVIVCGALTESNSSFGGYLIGITKVDEGSRFGNSPMNKRLFSPLNLADPFATITFSCPINMLFLETPVWSLMEGLYMHGLHVVIDVVLTGNTRMSLTIVGGCTGTRVVSGCFLYGTLSRPNRTDRTQLKADCTNCVPSIHTLATRT